MVARLVHRSFPGVLTALLALPACSFNDGGVGDVDAGGDQDGDGVADTVDNCVATPNGGQEDEDSDDVGNVCDNCPHIANLDQANGGDGDNAGDACDPDPSGPGNDIVLFEPFDDAGRMVDWHVSLGSDWQIADGALRQSASDRYATAYFGSMQFGNVLVDTRYVPSTVGTGTGNAPFEFGVYTAYAAAPDLGAGYFCKVTGDAQGNAPGTLSIVTARGGEPSEIEAMVTLSDDVVVNEAYLLRASLDVGAHTQQCTISSDALDSGASADAADTRYDNGLLAVRTGFTTGGFEYVVAFAVP